MIMSRILVFGTVLVVGLSWTTTGHAVEKEQQKTPAALDFKMKTLDGKDFDLDKFAGKVVLVVNVASKCGYTPQYEQLQAIYKRFADKGLVVAGFPCNQFGGQEPGTADEIREFCRANYGVTFPMFAKVDVNGPDACPLYKYLTSLDVQPKGEGKVSWNFEKFLISRDGKVIARFPSRTKPDDPELVKLIETQLQKKS